MTGFVKKNILLIIVCAVICVGTVGFVVYSATKSSAGGANVHLPGGAVAVMNTSVEIIDGKSDSPDSKPGDEFYYPRGIAIAKEAVIVADSMSDRIQIIGGSVNMRIGIPGSNKISYAGSGSYVDGILAEAQFNRPSDVALLKNGDIIVCDSGNNAIRKIAGDIVFTVAGGGSAGYRNGKEGEALFNNPQSVAVGSKGLIYVADTMNHCIRQISSDGNVTLFAGVPEKSGYADGDVLSAMFFEPHGLFLDEDGVLYVADSANHAIRKIENGVVTTVAGGSETSGELSNYIDGGFTDGSNGTAKFNFPQGLVVLSNGDIYVADTMNHAVRLISGEITRTILGNGQAEKFRESAENIRLSKPSGITSDGEKLYISDSLNNSVLVVPLNDAVKGGRLLRDVMLAETGITTESSYDYNGNIRLFANGERINLDRVHPWITPDRLFVPVIGLFEKLGAVVLLDEKSGTLIIEIGGQQTVLTLNQDYFMEKNVAVMPFDELGRLFPHSFEWFPEFSTIAVSDRLNS